jgi:glutamate synthase domain-containing protein 2
LLTPGEVFVYTAVVIITAVLSVEFVWSPSIYVVVPLVLSAFLAAVGTTDLLQKRHAVLRNYPLTAHIRFILEEIRPEIRQYFLESEKDGTPFSRDKRAIVYQRAKQALDKRPFGTQNDVYASGYEWLNHSIAPRPLVKEPFRVAVGGPDCAKPYSASIFNISAMSFGALSPNAIRALNAGAKKEISHTTQAKAVIALTIEKTAAILFGKSGLVISAAAIGMALFARKASNKQRSASK